MRNAPTATADRIHFSCAQRPQLQIHFQQQDSLLHSHMSSPYYITTPIYYVNDAPQIGNAYTTIAADVLARFFRFAGRDVHFLTGTDEHGIKVVKVAKERGITASALVDEVVLHFQDMWRLLGISNDDFIRTSEERHEIRVKEIVSELVARDEIYLGNYEGWYDEGQEEFVTEMAARAHNFRSPMNDRLLVRYQEPSYFFRLKKWAPHLLEHIAKHPDFVQPDSRRNEVVSKLKQGVEDLSISRLAEKLDGWGVRLPNDPDHVVYVWIDALTNYVTALGWPPYKDEPSEAYDRYWPANIHLIGKDILWFHAVYWPCLLMALEYPLPRRVYAHGWLTSEGRKMSKSLGNFISGETIREFCEEYSRDVFRYFLLREVPFGSDGDFSRSAFRGRYNTELANGVGNLLSRTTNMINRYCEGRLAAPTDDDASHQVRAAAESLNHDAESLMEACAIHRYLERIQSLVDASNRYIDSTAPYKLAKDPSQAQRVGGILNNCAQAVRIVLEALYPIMPDAALQGLEALGLDAPPNGSFAERTRWGALETGTVIAKAPPLFPRKG